MKKDPTRPAQPAPPRPSVGLAAAVATRRTARWATGQAAHPIARFAARMCAGLRTGLRSAASAGLGAGLGAGRVAALALLGAAALPTPALAQGEAGGVVDAALGERVQALLSSRLGPLPEGLSNPRVTVEIGQLDPRLRLAPCRRVEPQAPTSSPGLAWGRMRVGLRCVEGERPWAVWLPVTVRVHAPALVAARPLPAGTVLGEADLQTAEVDWAADSQRPHVRSSELVGRALSHALQAGQAVRADDLRRRQWFAAGDTVQVLARGAGFTVAGEATALGAGLEGQTVRLRTESGRVLSGRPVGQSRVEVAL